MSLDLVDFKRLRLTREARAMLTAESGRTGQSAQEIARDLLHEIALQKIDEARVLLALSPSEGHVRDGGGRRR